MKKNITNKELQILRLILGDEMVEEFLKYLENKKRNQYKITRHRHRRIIQKYVINVSYFREKAFVSY